MNSVNEMLRLLAAEGPVDEHPEKMMLFGQFVGSWVLDVFGYPADGSRLEYAGEWHFGWILDGGGIQDVLIVRPISTASDAPEGGKGSTMRVYDPQLDAWWITWMGPVDREFSALLARDEGERIVVEGQWTLGHPQRQWQWVFSDIEPESFRWQGRVLDADGGEGRLVEEMYARRRVP